MRRFSRLSSADAVSIACTHDARGTALCEMEAGSVGTCDERAAAAAGGPTLSRGRAAAACHASAHLAVREELGSEAEPAWNRER